MVLHALNGINNIGGKQREGLPDGGASSAVEDVFEVSEVGIQGCAYRLIECRMNQDIF